MMLALYTGQRRGDVFRMSWSDVDKGVIQFVQQKTGKRAWIPLHRVLRAELGDAERVSIRIVTGIRGQPLRGEGFKSMWQHQMEKVELATSASDGLVFHGLRKLSVCFLLEAG